MMNPPDHRRERIFGSMPLAAPIPRPARGDDSKNRGRYV
jgi:hypothetical protein